MKVGETFVYPNFDIYHFILNLLCIQDGFLGEEWSFNAPSWCISISLFLYIIFYYIAYKSKNENEIYYRCGIGAIIGASIILMELNYPIFNRLIGRGLLCFSIGAGLVKIYEEREVLNSRLLGYICLTALITLYLLLRFKGSEIFGNFQMAFTLGTLSINIYLFHFPVQCLIETINQYANLQLNYSSRKVWAVYVAVTLVASVLYKSFFSIKYEKIFKRVVFHLSE